MIRSSMFALMAILAVGALAGCQTNKDHPTAVTSGNGTVNTSADLCDKCAGVQTKVTSDGRCPECGAQIDVCPKCQGVQKATADGKCPVCKEPVATPSGASSNAPTTRPSAP